MPVVARRETTTSCFLSDSDESGCACSPEPIEEDSCGVSNTTVCYEECYDIFQLCFDPCLEFQEVCGDSCLINAIYGDAFTSLVCTCDCLGNAYDCYNLCASDFNTCACGCGSVNVPTLSPGIDGNGSSTGESITSCFPSGSDDSGCSCSPEPIEEDSCGVSITTACYEDCDDILDLCYNPCVQLQETCLNSCLMNVTNSDACRCGCLENAYDCNNLCAMEFNTCTCRCASVNVPTLSPGIDGNGSSTGIDGNGSSTGIDRNGSSSGTSGSSGSSTSGSFLGHAAAIRTLTAAGLAVVLWYM